MEKFAVLRKITRVTQSPYLLPGVMAASHCFPWERWNSWGLDCIHSWHVFMVCLFGMDGIFGLMYIFWWIFSLQSLSYSPLLGECFNAKCWGSLSLLSSIWKCSHCFLSSGAGTKWYDSHKNWGCYQHPPVAWTHPISKGPACHLWWSKTPGASSKSSRQGGSWSWCF